MQGAQSHMDWHKLVPVLGGYMAPNAARTATELPASSQRALAQRLSELRGQVHQAGQCDHSRSGTCNLIARRRHTTMSTWYLMIKLAWVTKT